MLMLFSITQKISLGSSSFPTPFRSGNRSQSFGGLAQSRPVRRGNSQKKFTKLRAIRHHPGALTTALVPAAIGLVAPSPSTYHLDER